jgi:NAD(P)-dependent dehydrogenase (short-subunit alcohol dehydrogenase family)
MVEYAQRFWTMYYAAKADNWALAKYMHSEMMKLGKIVPVVRPKYAEGMTEFEHECMEPLLAAITASDWSAFDDAYRRAVEGSDTYHDRFAKPFIRFRLPPQPPPLLEMSPEVRPAKE